MNSKEHELIEQGRRVYEESRERFFADPENRRVYEEEAAKKGLWLQLVEARQAAGLTQDDLAKRLGVGQSQVARLEKEGYDSYTLTSLRRYVQALGDGFELTVRVSRPSRRAGVTGTRRVSASP